LLEDEIDAASADYLEVQADACALAVDRELSVQRLTAQDRARNGRGLVRRTAGAIVLSSHITYSC
jgi:hypothetical protein